MPRTDIPVQQMASHGAGLSDVQFTAADDTNDHSFINDGNVLLMMKNVSAGIKTADIISIANRWGRTGDQTLTCPATTGISQAGPFPKSVWNQSGGVVHVDLTDDVDISFAAVRLPIKE